jgi:tRNA threonylcarbamoyladenosine biosynthesis protein TsaB
MRILGIDTATMISGIGVAEDGKILTDFKYDVKLTHSEVLLSYIEKLLKKLKLKLEDFDGFSVSIGPGSFTGLRIGLATIKGLGFASGKPVVGIPTLDALAFLSRGSKYPVVPLLDAKKKQVYAAVYHTQDNEIKRKSSYFVVDPFELIQRIPEEVAFTGPGTVVFRSEIKKKMGKKAHFLRGEKTLPSGAAVAYMGWEKIKQGEKEDLFLLEPIYVRKSEAELKFRNV